MNNHLSRRRLFVTGAQIAAALTPIPLLFSCAPNNVANPTVVPTTEPVAAIPSATPTITPSATPTITLTPSQTATPTYTPTPTLTPTPSLTPTPTLSATDLSLGIRYRDELLKASKAASAGGRWTEREFNDLIDVMEGDSLKRTSKTLNILPTEIDNYSSTAIMKKVIKTKIADISGGFFWKEDADNIKYHDSVLIPTAKNMAIDGTMIDTYDTLQLERAIYNKVLEQNWTSMQENERINFLEQSEWAIDPNKIVSLAALSGAAFLAGLSTVVKLSGFSFYMGMSNGLYALASALGLKLPFSVYMGASVAIKLATSPIGWIAAALLAATGIYAWIKKDETSKQADMLRMVLHLHHYKISAMEEAGLPILV